MSLDPETVAAGLEQRARDTRAASKTFARIMRRHDKGKLPSERRDGKAWEDAERVYEREGLVPPNAALLLWKE